MRELWSYEVMGLWGYDYPKYSARIKVPFPGDLGVFGVMRLWGYEVMKSNPAKLIADS